VKIAILVVAALATTAAASPIPDGATQLITGVTADWDAKTVTLQRWTRRGGAWVADGASWRGVVGHTGVAWGRGLHGDGAPTGHDGPIKREGDGKAPAGVFALRGAYGYAAEPPRHTQLAYTQTTATWQCVDDPASSHYTQIVDRTRLAAPDWASAEAMRRRDALYTWVIDIAHNPAATAGAGSCIFFHVWRDANTGTVGCTAMPAPAIATLIAHLDPSAVYVLLPRAAYAALAPAWALPPIPVAPAAK
jgi:L,D-peptidoglycan transpeptidase YkuD (ErfK/YbiS/YcfS/YnhG family)